MLLILFVIISLCITKVSAKEDSFSITSNVYYYDSSNVMKKTDKLNTATVRWYTTSDNNHNEWFRVINSNGEEKGWTFIKGKGNYKIFNVTCQQNYNYWLQARRENIWDPWTTVKGV